MEHGRPDARLDAAQEFDEVWWPALSAIHPELNRHVEWLVNSLRRPSRVLVLQGPPGSGKTSVLRRALRLSGQHHLNLDAWRCILSSNAEGQTLSQTLFGVWRHKGIREMLGYVREFESRTNWRSLSDDSEPDSQPPLPFLVCVDQNLRTLTLHEDAAFDFCSHVAAPYPNGALNDCVSSVFTTRNEDFLEQRCLHHERCDVRSIAHASNFVTMRYPAITLPVLVETANPSGQETYVYAVRPAWDAIARALLSTPELLTRFSKAHREFEEFLAGAYARAGWEVELTPRSGDRGRDLIATNRIAGTSIRVLEQAKAYRQGHLVTAEEVRALVGVKHMTPNSSKAILTTTSAFAPRVMAEFSHLMPYELELRDGAGLLSWLADEVM